MGPPPSCVHQEVSDIAQSYLTQIGEQYESGRMIAPIRVCAVTRIQPTTSSPGHRTTTVGETAGRAERLTPNQSHQDPKGPNGLTARGVMLPLRPGRPAHAAPSQRMRKVADSGRCQIN